MRTTKARVQTSGGGVVELLVHRDAEQYPSPGTEVIVLEPGLERSEDPNRDLLRHLVDEYGALGVGRLLLDGVPAEQRQSWIGMLTRSHFDDMRPAHGDWTPTNEPDRLKLLRDLVIAANRMRDGWAESDQPVKNQLWSALHLAAAAAEDVVYPLPTESDGLNDDQARDVAEALTDAMDVEPVWSLDRIATELERAIGRSGPSTTYAVSGTFVGGAGGGGGSGWVTDLVKALTMLRWHVENREQPAAIVAELHDVEAVWSLRHVYEVLDHPDVSSDVRRIATRMLRWHVERSEESCIAAEPSDGPQPAYAATVAGRLMSLNERVAAVDVNVTDRTMTLSIGGSTAYEIPQREADEIAYDLAIAARVLRDLER